MNGAGDLNNAVDILRTLRTGAGLMALVTIAVLCGLVWIGRAAPDPLVLAIASSIVGICVVVQLAVLIADWRDRRRLRIVMSFLQHDSAPAFCTGPDGAILSQNRPADERFGGRVGRTMTEALEPLFANPDAVIHRLRLGAEDGVAGVREDVVTRRGHVRIAVHRMPGGFLWRLEDLVDRPKRTADGIGLPTLTFGPSGTILYMNEVLRAAVGQRVKRLGDLFETLPLGDGELNHLLTGTGRKPVRAVLSEPVNGRREVFILPAGDKSDDHAAFDTLPVGLLRLDADGRVTFANRLARDLLPAMGTGDERRLGALVEGLGRSVREWVSEAAAGRGLYRPEVVRVSGADVETYLQITLGRPLTGGDGGLVAVVNDATELKTLEAQFVQSQKMQAIGQLAGGVAHDFNNLLTAISGHCDLLMLRHAEGDEDHADLTQITQNANRAAGLVGQLLAFSRKQTLEMQPIDLRDTLSDLTHLLNRLVGDRVTLRLDHDPALLPIRGDRRQLEQILMNLVVNARDAMPQGGDIKVATECRYLISPLERDRVTVPGGQYVVITVTDSGTGIQPDNLSRIFEPFFTTKRPGEGTGLGLSMAYGIVKQSGGYIFADSTLGEGTCFSLYFPALAAEDLEAFQAAAAAAAGETEAGAHARRSDPDSAARPVPVLDPPARDAVPAVSLEAGQAASSEVPSGANEGLAVAPSAEKVASTLIAQSKETNATTDGDPPKAGGMATTAPLPDPSDAESQSTKPGNEARRAQPVVLLVEDEAPVRAFASRALRLRGYDVREAENAEAALAQLEDKSLLIDLFVTDVMMPGLDGPTWVRQAMEARPNVRTVFISGYTQDALSETSVPVPNSVFLPKPFSLTDLTQTVERALA